MEYNNKGDIGEFYTNNPIEIGETYIDISKSLEDSTKIEEGYGGIDSYIKDINEKKPYDNFVKNRYNIKKSFTSLLPTRKIPECWEEIESLILERIGKYPEIEVGGLFLTNGYEVRETKYYTGDKDSIDPDTCKYIFEVNKEQFYEMVGFLYDDFIRIAQEEYMERFLSEVKERGLYNRFAELVEQNLENSDLNFFDEELSKIEIEKPKGFTSKDITLIRYHSHPSGSLKPSRTDIESVLKDESESEPPNILHIIAGKGRCEWYKLRFLSDYEAIGYVL
ncbi:MAG: hypothetical protein KAT28_00055 [Candidatus Aenigmarchaeota archaeon]|nr:hypothetical protein [Candidatus Aenigmarchaeota archaeon]